MKFSFGCLSLGAMLSEIAIRSSTPIHLLRSAKLSEADNIVINGFVYVERRSLYPNKNCTYVRTKQSLALPTVALSHTIALS